MTTESLRTTKQPDNENGEHLDNENEMGDRRTATVERYLRTNRRTGEEDLPQRPER
jgi:hypothetical protein